MSDRRPGYGEGWTFLCPNCHCSWFRTLGKFQGDWTKPGVAEVQCKCCGYRGDRANDAKHFVDTEGLAALRLHKTTAAPDLQNEMDAALGRTSRKALR